MATNVKYKIYNGTTWEELIFPVAAHSHSEYATNASPTFTGTIDASEATLKIKTINAPTTPGGSTYSAGSIGFVLKSNGSTIYWDTDNNTTYYEHNIRIYYSTNNISVTFKFVDTNSSAYTYSTLTYALYNKGFTSNTTVCPATGVYGTASAQNLITGVYGYNSSSTYRLYFRYLPLVSYSSPTATINNTVSGENSTYLTLSSSYTINDKVRTL